jgi:hypothetical protein
MAEQMCEICKGIYHGTIIEIPLADDSGNIKVHQECLFDNVKATRNEQETEIKIVFRSPN